MTKISELTTATFQSGDQTAVVRSPANAVPANYKAVHYGRQMSFVHRMGLNADSWSLGPAQNSVSSTAWKQDALHPIMVFGAQTLQVVAGTNYSQELSVPIGRTYLQRPMIFISMPVTQNRPSTYPPGMGATGFLLHQQNNSTFKVTLVTDNTAGRAATFSWMAIGDA